MKRLRHRAETSALQVLSLAARRLPYRSALAVGRAAGRASLALGLRRRVVLENLRSAFPAWDAARLRCTARETYEIWGEAAIDLLRSPLLVDERAWQEVMEPVTGLERIGEARKRGRGVILLSAHFGVFEFLGAAAARAGYPVDFIVQRQSNPWVERRLGEARRRWGIGSIGRGSGLRNAIRALDENRCVAMAADQDARGRGVFVEFLGRPASTPAGPAALSLRSGAPIIMGFMVRGADGRHRGELIGPLEFSPSGDFERDVLALTQQHARELEARVRRHPEHWYWLHRRWKTKPPEPTPAPGRVAAAGALALALTTLLALAGPAPGARAAEIAPKSAEPTTFGGAGTSLLPLAETRVARVVEDLLVRRAGEGWTVDAVDVFLAGGAPEVVTVGLPDFEAAGDSAGSAPTLDEVRLSLDGVDLAPEITAGPGSKNLPGLGGIARFFVWKLSFAAEEWRVARLHFRVRSSRTERGDELLFFYLNTGTPWRGASGRVNARFELGQATSDELVADWLRPQRFGVEGHSVSWVLASEEPEEDLVVALRPFADPLADFSDRERGPLALSRSDRLDWIARGTPREWSFWRAFLQARLGQAPADSLDRVLLSRESWYRKAVSARPRPPSREERETLADLEQHLADWRRHAIPSSPAPEGPPRGN